MARTFSGEKLRDRRCAVGLRPEQVALQVGRSVYAIHEYERGRSRPAAEVLGALADVLDCTIDAFYVQALDAAA